MTSTAPAAPRTARPAHAAYVAHLATCPMPRTCDELRQLDADASAESWRRGR